MPIPVLLGLPWLAATIGGYFVTIFSFFAADTAKRLAVLLAGLAVFASLTGAFSLAIKAFLDAVAYPVPNISAIYLIIPSNFPSVVSAFISLRLLRWAYDWNIKIVRLATHKL